MSAASCSPQSVPSIGYRVHLQDGRELTLRRLASGSLKLEWSSAARDGTRRITAATTFGESLMRQSLAACAVLHHRVEMEGPPNAS
jgi:hypothetical protein